MTIYLIIAGIILCLFLSAFFSMSEMSLASSNKVRVENLAEERDKKAIRTLKLINNYDDALGTILIGNNLVNIAASSLSSVFVILLFNSEKYTWVASIIITILVIIFGETIPKIVAKKNATKISLRISYPINVLHVILTPIVWLVVKLVKVLTNKQNQDDDLQLDDEESVEELTNIIETAEDEGIIDEDQSELLINALDFGDVSAYEVMTARVDIDAIDFEDSIEEIFETVKNSNYTRLPVYMDSIDNIIGILHLNDFLVELAKDLSMTKEKFKSILMEPVYVYKTIKLPDVLKSLREKTQHLAIVTDEFSGTFGIITLEDVMESIVGEIWDENDIVEEEVVLKNENEYELDGDLSIFEFLELVDIKEEDYEYYSQTLGGLIMELLERYPKKDDEVQFNHLLLKVIEAGDRRVEKVHLTILENTDEVEE